MRALRFHQFGLENLRLEEVPPPQPAPNEVLIKVRASAIQPSDVKNVQGIMANLTKLPRIPGRDFAGIIVNGLPDSIGQEVWGTGGDLGFTRDGTHAEFICVPSEAVVPKPANLTLEQTGAMGLSVVVAWAALFDCAELKRGETVLVIGANGTVGHAAAQLASWAGARVIGVDRDSSNTSQSDIMLSSSSSTFNDDLRAAAGEGVQVALDTVGGPMFDIAMNSLATGGRMVIITAGRDSQTSIDLLRFYRKDLRLIGLNTLNLDAIASANILKEAVRPIVVGWLKPRDVQPFALDDAVRAYAQPAERGKIRVLVNEH